MGGGVNDLTLADVNVTGTEAAGALVGENQGLLSGIQSSGQVSGELHVGGLVGLNLRLVYLSRSSAAVTGMRPPFPPGVNIIVTYGPPSAAGGLVGYNTGFVVYSYATGPVTSDSSAGGLVGYHQSKLIAASYATGPVSGSSAGGLVGTVATPFQEATIRASYATGSVDGGTAGGLVGHVYDEGIITASYATGRVPDGRNNGGLVGDDERGTVTNSYWDTRTSGHTSGSPGSGRTTSQLQSPSSYSGIYGSWNVDLEGDGMNDDPWNFGTSSQYPALKVDMDGDDDATWAEFGYQLRSGPTLTATPTTNAGQSQVELEWTEAPLNSEWSPAPSLSYTVTREDDENLETIAENLTVLEYTDTDVAGETYIYQVVAVVDGGEAVRSATVSVTVAGNKRPVAVGRLRWRTLLVGDSAMTEVGGAFQDPEGDNINYAVSSSDTTVARVTLSGTRVTIIPVAEGRTFITVTATDDGSNRSRTQQFGVTVRPTTTVDYDTDDDGLIEISNLAQLDAVRYDNGGRGSNLATAHREAFPDGGNVLACGGLLGCVGYELLANLDFDTDGDGAVDSDDDYWNNGAGWMPIKTPTTGLITPYSAIFEGNGHTITNLFIDSSENDIGLFGETRSSAVIRNLEMVSVQLTGTDNVGGLVGSNGGAVSGCFATGKVSGDDDVGGLVGSNLNDGAVSASYSTVQVTGDDRIGGLAGSNSGNLTAAYATGRVVGDFEAGGLIGRNSGDVNVSYATGLVSGRSTIGGLIGWNASGGGVTDSFWDSDTSGRTTGFSGQAKTTAELQLPTAASGIYSAWNLDLDGDGMNDDPWDFGTSSQYPVLSVDTNGVGGATWQEFGRQVRAGPNLMATPTVGQVTLTWSAISGGTYNLYRTAGTTVEILAENTSSRSHVDTDVTGGATYVYQVAAVVNGGEGSRSPRVSVDVPMPGALPTVTLELSPAFISENGGSAMVTARLSHTSSETTTVTVSATAISPAVMGDFRLSANRTLTITAGQANSTGTVAIRANNNNVHAPNKTVRVSGSASNSQGVTGPADVTLTIVDDDPAPTVTLELSQTSIGENRGSTTVTARLNRVSSEMTMVRVSAAAVSPAVSRDFTLSANQTLTITAGQTASTETVTITANDNDADTPSKTVRVSGSASNSQGVIGPADVTLTITDDDPAPTVTLRLSRTSITENRGSTTVTARLDRASSETTTVAVSVTPVNPAVEGDFTLSTNQTLTITAGRTSSTGTVTIRANDNDVDTPDKTVRVSGSASNTQGVTDPDNVTLTITDDDSAPTVTLELSQTSISENRGSTAVTAKLDRASSETTTVTVSVTPVNPAVEGDFTLSTNQTLFITAGRTSSTGTVTITANDNVVDAPNKTVRVSGSASNSQGVTDPSDVTLTITDDDAAPTVTLELSQTSISENGGSTTVTAKLNRASSVETTVTVSAAPVSPAVSGDFSLSANQTLTIPAGQTSSTGTVTIRANNNDLDTPNKTVRVSGRTRNTQGVTNPADVTLTITDDDAAPTVTLELSADSISENGGSTTVRAKLNRASSETTTVTVSATAVSPAVSGDFSLSANQTLTITAGQTSSTGTVTIRANNNDADTPNKTVRVSGSASNSQGVTDPDDVTLTITDDDGAPTVTLELSQTSISENGGSTTVTARLNRRSSVETTVTVSATAVSPAVSGDFTLSANQTLTITAGQTNSTGTVTIRANNNDVDAPNKTVRVSGSAGNSQGVTDPADVTLTITDDDPAPTVTLELSQTSISENGGSTTVTAKLDRASSETTTVTVSVTPVDPAVEGDFTLSTNQTLTITAGRTSSTGTVTIRANNNDVDRTEQDGAGVRLRRQQPGGDGPRRCDAHHHG